MEDDVLKKFEAQDAKLNAIYRSVERTRKYFLWTLIITAMMIILPLIGLIFIIPAFIGSLDIGNLEL